METLLKYRGRRVSTEDISFIQALIAEHPNASRRSLSKILCAQWGWLQANGQLRDMVCRGLMLALHRAGHIQLPEVRYQPPNNVIARRRPAVMDIDTRPLRMPLAELKPLAIRQVRATTEAPLFNTLLETHHYLAYTRPVGEHLKYLVYAKDRPIACLAWCSAPRHLGPRDRFIGWSGQARKQNIRFLAYNTRFLILPWVEVPHLASHLLGYMARMLSSDWQHRYGHGLYYLESFVDPVRFRGTCYRAANWHFLGLTKGLGKAAQSKQQNRPCKEVLGYPLSKQFRELLAAVR